MTNIAGTIRPDTAKRHEAKYRNGNRLHRQTLNRFFDRVSSEIAALKFSSILDFGCGEAFFWEEVKSRMDVPAEVVGIDLRSQALEKAKLSHPEFMFMQQDILSWEPDRKFDLVIASQVLEHLVEPGRFLKRLCEVSHRHLLLSVPWEPLFRLCNLARGRDLGRLGNHPEHVNHWGQRSFERFVSRYARVERSITCFPFLIIVARPRMHDGH